MLVPLWCKIAYTIFVGVLVPVYWRCWGPRNFLWFSDVALLATTAALWLESALLASMMTLVIALPETGWNVDFFGRIATGRQLLGLSGYMFDARTPRWLRALSLFHVVLPLVLLALVVRLGYDRRARLFQTLLAWLWLPLKFARWLHLILVMILFPLVFYLPVHLILSRLLGRA